ncbi:hypothetical protein NSQ82_03095 [Caldifermentibacillus hisashii]|uniref:hypothetical protein n=1 Tax=Caldifermentibacillus hisashii TaxID=996558 RepID=UPI0031B6787F
MDDERFRSGYKGTVILIFLNADLEKALKFFLKEVTYLLVVNFERKMFYFGDEPESRHHFGAGNAHF